MSHDALQAERPLAKTDDSSSSEAPRRPPAPQSRMSQPQLAARADALVKAFNSWAFKREQPDDPARLRQLAARAIEFEQPLAFVLYWGRGPREEIAEPERQCLAYLSALAARVQARHAPGTDVTLILTDTHAALNGYPTAPSRRYFDAVETEAKARDFRSCYLRDLVIWAQDRIDEARANDPPSSRTLEMLTASAAKWYRGEQPVEEGARLYFQANMIERQAVEAAFPEAIFVTFNGSDQRALFPEKMPIFYMYSLRKGVAVKPWFMAAEEPTRELAS